MVAERGVTGRSPDLGQFVEELQNAASELDRTTIGNGIPSKVQEVTRMMSDFTAQLEKGSMESKKLVNTEMQASIEQALNAIFGFGDRQKKQKSQEEAMTALVVALLQQANLLRERLGHTANLKDEYAIGKKVEKTNRSKHS